MAATVELGERLELLTELLGIDLVSPMMGAAPIYLLAWPPLPSMKVVLVPLSRLLAICCDKFEPLALFTFWVSIETEFTLEEVNCELLK